MHRPAANNHDTFDSSGVLHVGAATNQKERPMTSDSDKRRTETTSSLGGSQVDKGVESTVDTLHDQARRVGETLHGEVERATEALKEQMRHAKLLTQDASRSLQHRIAEHPVSSIAIAAGVGVLIGMVILRRGSRP
jgi:ElaB/YqjD/DUF883 family membrane-anchored ribosome-binding protein